MPGMTREVWPREAVGEHLDQPLEHREHAHLHPKAPHTRISLRCTARGEGQHSNRVSGASLSKRFQEEPSR